MTTPPPAQPNLGTGTSSPSGPTPPRHTAPGAGAEAETVYVVAGGDMVAVFDDPDAAAAQQAVRFAAGLDTRTFTVPATEWDSVRPLVEVVGPSLVIIDVRTGRADDAQ